MQNRLDKLQPCLAKGYHLHRNMPHRGLGYGKRILPVKLDRKEMRLTVSKDLLLHTTHIDFLFISRVLAKPSPIRKTPHSKLQGTTRMRVRDQSIDVTMSRMTVHCLGYCVGQYRF
jgi:hypothetical protein